MTSKNKGAIQDHHGLNFFRAWIFSLSRLMKICWKSSRYHAKSLVTVTYKYNEVICHVKLSNQIKTNENYSNGVWHIRQYHWPIMTINEVVCHANLVNILTRGPWATALTRVQMRYVFNKSAIFIKQRSTQRWLLPNYFEIWQLVFNKKIFLSFQHGYVRQTGPNSWCQVFQRTQSWTILVESDLGIISAKLIWNLTIDLWQDF